MIKVLVAFLLVIFLSISFQDNLTSDPLPIQVPKESILLEKPKTASATDQDSDSLRLQDMLMNMLTPYIRKDLNKYYHPKILKNFYPQVSPQNIEVIETKRLLHFSSFILEITFEIEPDDGGHHVLVGKDRMTYRISYGPEVELINHTHLATYDLPDEPSYNPKVFQEYPQYFKKRGPFYSIQN
jgi:hypothetical protein